MRSLFYTFVFAFTCLPTPILGQHPSPLFIDTLSSDQDGHHKGDVRISLPSSVADQLNDAISKLGGHNQCKNFQLKRQNAVDIAAQQARVAGIVQALMPLAIPGALINGFGLQNQIAVPGFRDPIVRAQIVAVQAWASCQAALARVDVRLLNTIVKLVYIAVKNYCEHNDQIRRELWLLDLEIDKTESDNNDDHCPPRKSESPPCEDCKGSADDVCTTGQYKGCSCLQYAEVFTQPGNRRDLEKAQAVLADMIGQAYPPVKKTDGGDLQCGTAYDQGNANYFTTISTINRAAAFFCKQMGDQKIKFEAKKAADKHELNYNNHHWDPVYVAVEWNPDDPGSLPLDFSKAEAQKVCKDRLTTIIDNCDTASNDKLNWKQGGTYYKSGMKWYINRDSWAVGQVNSDPAWNPRIVTCQMNEDCSHTPWPCQGACQKDSRYSDVGYCPCGSGL